MAEDNDVEEVEIDSSLLDQNPTENNEDDSDVDSEINYEKEYGCTQDEYEEAVAQGWNPDRADERSAKEFIERGSFFKKINAQNKRINQLETQVQFFANRADAADAAARETLKKDLLQAKTIALQEEDHEQVVEIDEQLAILRDQENESKIETNDDVTSEPSPEYDSWLKQNSWYDRNSPNFNPRLNRLADSIAQEYITENGEPEDESDYTRILNYVSREIKRDYSEMFSNPKRKQAASVDTGTKTTRGRKSTQTHTANDLDPSERAIMKNMIAKGHIKDEATYVKQLADSGFFKNRD